MNDDKCYDCIDAGVDWGYADSDKCTGLCQMWLDDEDDRISSPTEVVVGTDEWYAVVGRNINLD